MANRTRREILAILGATAVAPSAFGADSRPCYEPRYIPWTDRRAARWPERVGDSGFVNYYGEPYKFDAALGVPRDSLPTCSVWGADMSTLDSRGKVREHLYDLEVRGKKSSTDCQLWPSGNAPDFDFKISGLVEELRRACPTPTIPAPVRFVAVGSHHSSSDVYKRPDETRAVMVRVDGINHIFFDRPEWKPGFGPGSAFAMVGAGITVCQLNEALWDAGLALETQGSFDGQSLAGAISTGTHGAGSQHGAIADSVEAIVVATCLRDPATGAGTWEIVQIEPSAGQAITDAARWQADRAGVKWRLVQDDGLFESAIVSMGTMGVIVAYVMRVRSAYFLRELRVGRPWSEVSGNLVERATTPATGFSGVGWRYELVVNPTAVAGMEDWVCTEVYRDAWTYDLDYLSEIRDIPDKWAGGFTRNVNLGGQLGNVVAGAADSGLARGKRLGMFADRCYRVLKLGQGEFVQAWGTEFMVPGDRAEELVRWILRTNPEKGFLERGKARGTRLLNPFGVRFARGKKGYLSPTRRWRDGAADLTCTVELTEAVKDDDTRNLGVRENGKPSSKAIVESWAEDFVREFGADGRLHWGQLQGAFRESHLQACYPADELDRWYAAFRALNPYGLFDNAWAVRVGFVARRAADSSAAPSYPGL